MHASFSVGLLAGVLLASAVVFGSIFFSAPTQNALGPLYSAAGTASTTTATSTSSSTTVQVPGVTSLNAVLSTTTSTNSSAVSNANVPTLTSSFSSYCARSALPSPRIGGLLRQPGQAPVLLLPLIAALMIGFALYKLSIQKD